MNALCWNCGGLGNPRAVGALRKWCAARAPNLVFLSETMISSNASKNVKSRLGFDCAFGVSSVGKAGGLCNFWNSNNISFDLVSYSQNHICGDVLMGTVSWRFVGLYGWPGTSDKHKTWLLIKTLCDAYDGPILIGGDFNEILNYEEKEGGADTERRAIAGFREVMDDCNLRDLGYEGQWYTWERGITVATMVRERLDRYVSNNSWLSLFPDITVEHMVRFKSDHVPIHIRQKKVKKKRGQRKRNTKFETAWLLDESCEATVKQAWEKSDGAGTASRLELMLGALKGSAGEKFTNFQKEIDEAEKALKLVQERGISTDNIALCSSLEAKLDDLYGKQEAHWYLRSRSSEIKDGDKNTKYFHHKASQRKKRNEIKGLTDAKGEWCTEEDEFEPIIQEYYEQLFSSQKPTEVACMTVLDSVPVSISTNDNALLQRPLLKGRDLCSHM